MRSPTIFLLSSILLPLISAQQVPDGVIVPFTSVLPACASKCGPLFDVQGACSVAATAANTCFCADPRLKPFLNAGTAGVSSVCVGDGRCTAADDLQKIQNWYQGFCNVKVTSPTTASTSTTATATATGKTSGSTSKPNSATTTPTNQSWFSTHWKWVVMIIVILVAMIVIWVGAVLLKRRYNRKKEKAMEMKPPVAWGPHQMQHSTSGYSYGDGIVDVSGSGGAKEARSMTPAIATPAGGKRESKGWLKKNRNIS